MAKPYGNRDEKGRYTPGPMPEKLRKAVAHGAVKRGLQIREALAALPEPDRKKCRGCGEWKEIEEFRRSRQKRVDGTWVYYRIAYCFPCESQRGIERKRAWREKLGPEELRRRSRKWSKKWYEENKEVHNETIRMERFASGKTKRPRARPTPREPTMYVDGAVFLRWLSDADVELTNTEKRRISDVRAGRQRRINLETVDRIMTRAGQHDQVSVLFPSGN